MKQVLRTAWEWPSFCLAAGHEYYRTGLVCLPPSWLVTRRQDPYPFYAKLRDHSPIHRSSFVGGVILSRASDVEHALSDERLSSDMLHFQPSVRNAANAPGANGRPECANRDALGPQRPMMLCDGDLHARYRTALTTALDGGLRETLLAQAARRTEDSLIRLPAVGQAELMGDFVLPLTREFTLEFLGIPPAKRPSVERLMRPGLLFAWSKSEALFRFPAVMSRDFSGASEFRREVRQTFLSLLDAVEDGQGGLLPTLLRMAKRAGLSPVEAAVLAEEIMVASFEPPAYMLGNTLLALAQRPLLYDQLRREPHRIRDAIKEFQRYDPAIQSVVRYARHDFTIRKEQIRSGEPVVILLGSANRDPRVFQNADEIDIDRAQRQQFTFGKGAHACVGARIARAAHEIVLTQFIRRFGSLRLTNRPTWRSNLPMRGLQALPVALN